MLDCCGASVGVNAGVHGATVKSLRGPEVLVQGLVGL